jgi:hypothetical protein
MCAKCVRPIHLLDEYYMTTVEYQTRSRIPEAERYASSARCYDLSALTAAGRRVSFTISCSTAFARQWQAREQTVRVSRSAQLYSIIAATNVGEYTAKFRASKVRDAV